MHWQGGSTNLWSRLVADMLTGDPNLDMLRRWRLILGRYAQQPLQGARLSSTDWNLDQTLDFLYGREYNSRGLMRSL